MDSIIGGLTPQVMFLLGLTAFALFLILGISRGNPFTLGIMLKLGFIMYSGDIRKDFKFVRKNNPSVKGFISIPNTAYSPIFPYENGSYKHHDFLGRVSDLGELVVDESGLAQSIKPLSLTPDMDFGDLTIIRGAVGYKGANTATSKFTSLIRYVNTDLKKYYPVITLHQGEKTRSFKLLFAVQLGVEDKYPLDFSSRENFISSLRNRSFFDSREKDTSNILILNGSTGIDSVLLVLRETEGY